MIRSVLNFLSGFRTVCVPESDRLAALNLLKKSGCAHWGMKREQDGSIRFRMRLRDSEKYLKECEKRTLGVRGLGKRGVPYLLDRFSSRWGIPLGAVLFFTLVWLSGTVVWGFEVTGNRETEDEEIIALLRANGFSEGSRFRNLDFDVLQNRVLMEADSLSWIAVNMRGTVACVEVREKKPGDSLNSGELCNIVAAEDGQITEIRVHSGKAAAERLSTVRKGELLIGGVVTYRENFLHCESASGEVFAEVRRTVAAEIPYVQMKKTYTEEKCIRKTLIFFGKEINLFQNTGIDSTSCDTITMYNQICLPGETHLPVYLITESVRMYEMTEETKSREEAYKEALQLFAEERIRLMETVEILSLETEVQFLEDRCRIFGEARCVADIARRQTVTVYGKES